MSQLDISFGKKLRDAGIQQAVDHANEDSWYWSQKAYEKLLLFIENHPEPFLAEQARDYAERSGLEIPPSLRSWGSIIVKAVKEGKIIRVGYSQVSNAKAHRANSSLWKKK
jgi:hypothetical protein